MFLLILKRDRDGRDQTESHKNHRQRESLSFRPSLSILVRTLIDATVTVTLQNQEKHCIFKTFTKKSSQKSLFYLIQAEKCEFY